MMLHAMAEQVETGMSGITKQSSDRSGRISETTLLALYSENGEVARTMGEWRHKLILLYVATVGALATTTVWLREHQLPVVLRWELVGGSVIMCLFALMEHRTTKILHACYRIGTALEVDLTEGGIAAIYSALDATGRHRKWLTYANLLRAIYATTALLLATLALIVR
jgi:hypothetical protein